MRIGGRILGLKYKHDEVRSGNEALRDLLMSSMIVFGAGCIDDRNFLKYFGRLIDPLEVGIDDFLPGGFSVENLLYRICHRGGSHLAYIVVGVQECIDKATFTRFHLADNHKHKGLLNARLQI